MRKSDPGSHRAPSSSGRRRPCPRHSIAFLMSSLLRSALSGGAVQIGPVCLAGLCRLHENNDFENTESDKALNGCGSQTCHPVFRPRLLPLACDSFRSSSNKNLLSSYFVLPLCQALGKQRSRSSHRHKGKSAEHACCPEMRGTLPGTPASPEEGMRSLRLQISVGAPARRTCECDLIWKSDPFRCS